MAQENSLNNKTSAFSVTSFGSGAVQSNSSGVLSSSNGGNGQVLIGGGAAPSWANITSNASTITVTNGANTINLEVSNSPSGIPFTVVNGSTQTMLTNNGYVIDYTGGTCTLTFPTTAAVGDFLYIVGNYYNSMVNFLWQFNVNAGQQIVVSNSVTSAYPAGSVTGVNQATIILVCTTANTKWQALPSASYGGTIIIV